MIVRQSDAHAWAEALIDGQWQRFDPTAAVAPSRIELGLGGALRAGEPLPLLARLDGTWLTGVQPCVGCVQLRLAAQRHRLQLRPPALVVARMEARPARAVAGRGPRRRCSSPAWSGARRRLAHVEAPPPGARAGAVGRPQSPARARRPAAASARRTARLSPRARRRAGRSSRSPSRRSATRSRSCATARSTDRARARPRWSRDACERGASRCCRRRRRCARATPSGLLEERVLACSRGARAARAASRAPRSGSAARARA